MPVKGNSLAPPVPSVFSTIFDMLSSSFYFSSARVILRFLSVLELSPMPPSTHWTPEKLDVARQISLVVRSLGGALPVPAALAHDPIAVEAELDRQRYASALTRLVLSTLLVELLVKHVWETARSKESPHNHDILRLVQQLDPSLVQPMREEYDLCVSQYLSALAHGTVSGQQVCVEFASFEDALDWNGWAMVHLKYTLRPLGKAVPYGVFWNSDTHWVLPPSGSLPNFALRLLHSIDSLP